MRSGHCVGSSGSLDGISPPTLFFCFEVMGAVPGPLYFRICFRIKLLNLQKKIMITVALSLQTSSLSIYECSTAVC